jgi:uncharacterized protein GlcG (DUF336 family)
MILRSLFLALGAAVCTLGAASAQDTRPVLNHATVTTIMDTCLAWSEERDLNMSIAVVDASTQLRGFITMDDARYVTRAIAERKAVTAATFGSPSGQVEWVGDVPGALSDGVLIVLQGGVPVFTEDGALLGGVGVSGAPAAVDEQCAMAGVEAAGLVHGVEVSETE